MLTEGRLSVYWLPHLRRLALARFIGRYLAGRARETPGFRSFRTSRLKVQTRRDHLVALAQLYEALGGGWPMTPGAGASAVAAPRP